MKKNCLEKIEMMFISLVLIAQISCGDNGSANSARRNQGLPYSNQSYSITLMEADNGWKIHNLSISSNGEASAQVEDKSGSSAEYRGQAFVGGDAASVKLVKRVGGYESYIPPAGIMLYLNGIIKPGCFNATGAFLSSYTDNKVFLNIKWQDLPNVVIHWGDLKITDKVELRFPEC